MAPFHYLVGDVEIKTFVAESVFPEDFYKRQWEGDVVEEIVRLVDGKTSYRIVINASLLRRAIKNASENAYDIFHLSADSPSNQCFMPQDPLASLNRKGNTGRRRSLRRTVAVCSALKRQREKVYYYNNSRPRNAGQSKPASVSCSKRPARSDSGNGNNGGCIFFHALSPRILSMIALSAGIRGYPRKT